MRIHGGSFSKSTNILDVSAKLNPLGMPYTVLDAVVDYAHKCVHYHEPKCTELTARLADFERVSASQIVCGNGAADLIDRIVRAFRPKRALICAPTFSEYAYALRSADCQITEYLLNPTMNYQLDDSFLSAISDDLDMVFLCTPNNPTGQRICPDLLRLIADKCRKHNVLLVSDECFLRFTSNAEAYSFRVHFSQNCIILNAFTKLYAMPGLRLGYAVCGCADFAERIRQTGQFWCVSVPAQAAGIAALNEVCWIEKTVRYVAAERKFLTDSLRQARLTVFDADANFLLLKAPADFADEMKKRNILVRRCTDFHGLTDEHFRIAVRTHAENLALVSAVREVTK